MLSHTIITEFKVEQTRHASACKCDEARAKLRGGRQEEQVSTHNPTPSPI